MKRPRYIFAVDFAANGDYGTIIGVDTKSGAVVFTSNDASASLPWWLRLKVALFGGVVCAETAEVWFPL